MRRQGLSAGGLTHKQHRIVVKPRFTPAGKGPLGICVQIPNELRRRVTSASLSNVSNEKKSQVV